MLRMVNEGSKVYTWEFKVSSSYTCANENWSPTLLRSSQRLQQVGLGLVCNTLWTWARTVDSHMFGSKSTFAGSPQRPENLVDCLSSVIMASHGYFLSKYSTIRIFTKMKVVENWKEGWWFISSNFSEQQRLSLIMINASCRLGLAYLTQITEMLKIEFPKKTQKLECKYW